MAGNMITGATTRFANKIKEKKAEKQQKENDEKKKAVEELAKSQGIDISANRGGEINPPSGEVESLSPTTENVPEMSGIIEGVKAKETAENDPVGANIDKVAIGKDLTQSTRNAGDEITGNIGAEIKNKITPSTENSTNMKNAMGNATSNNTDNNADLSWQERIANGTATDEDIKTAYEAYKNGEYNPGPETLKEIIKMLENGNGNSWDDSDELTEEQIKELYDTYRAPKNGAEYIKRLLDSEQKGGKAMAIANVLGNLLGAVGGGKDYVSDWQKYRDNYIKAEQERNQREYNDAMDIVKQARTNKQSRKDMLAQIDLAIKRGAKLSAEEMAAIKNFSLGTGQSSYMDAIMAQIMLKAAPYIDDFIDLGGKAIKKLTGDKK